MTQPAASKADVPDLSTEQLISMVAEKVPGLTPEIFAAALDQMHALKKGEKLGTTMVDTDRGVVYIRVQHGGQYGWRVVEFATDETRFDQGASPDFPLAYRPS